MRFFLFCRQTDRQSQRLAVIDLPAERSGDQRLNNFNSDIMTLTRKNSYFASANICTLTEMNEIFSVKIRKSSS